MSRGPCVFFYIGKYKRGEYTLTVQRAHKQFEIGPADEYKRREFTTTETVVVLDNKKKIQEISSNRASHELRFLLLLRIFSRFRRTKLINYNPRIILKRFDIIYTDKSSLF